MTTTPEPAVSPAPDTDALRQQIAQRLSDVDARDWGSDHGFVPSYGSDTESDAFVDAVVSLVAEREAGLRADLDRARADAVAWERAARAEVDSARIQIDSLSRMLRGMARRASGLREVARDNAAAHHAEQALSWQAVRTAGRKHEREIRRWREEVERLTAELARVSGARTIPDDAAELVAKRMLRIKLYGVALSTRYDWQAHRQWTQQLTDDERADWLRDARALLADLGATPTTGPAPAAADVQWLPATFVNTAGGVGCASCNGYQALGHDGECYPYGQGPTPDRLPPNTRIVAAPQAPAQPTELPSSLLAATLTNLGITQAELARRTGISTKHINFVIKGKAGLGPDVANALAEATGVPASRWNHAEANRRSGLAAREDTAPPAPVVHEVTVLTDQHDDYFVARCTPCGFIAGDADEQWVQDRADSHRADNLIPARPSAPPVDGDTDA